MNLWQKTKPGYITLQRHETLDSDFRRLWSFVTLSKISFMTKKTKPSIVFAGQLWEGLSQQSDNLQNPKLDCSLFTLFLLAEASPTLLAQMQSARACLLNADLTATSNSA